MHGRHLPEEAALWRHIRDTAEDVARVYDYRLIQTPLVEDMRVELSDWGFDPTTLRRQTSLWQGDEDSFVGIASAHRWAETVPDLTLRLLPGEGHLFPFTRTSELIESLTDV